MASMAASVDDDDMRSEAPSTCGDWPASDDEDEEEVVVVGDVATLLPNENVKKIDVCESGVWHMYPKLGVLLAGVVELVEELRHILSRHVGRHDVENLLVDVQ